MESPSGRTAASTSRIATTSRIRRVGPDGIITTVAGTGDRGFSGDGGPATQAQLDSARGLAVGRTAASTSRTMTISRIRRVGPDGIITTVAGTGHRRASAATAARPPQAQLDLPCGAWPSGRTAASTSPIEQQPRPPGGPGRDHHDGGGHR